MKKFVLIGVMLFSLVFYGCNVLPGDQVKTDSLDYRPELSKSGSLGEPGMLNSGLPVKKLVITSGTSRYELEVEVAANEVQRQVGLMNRESLSENKGMLFVFQSDGFMNFWMKNTLIPLDMLFIDTGGYVRHIVHNAVPCTADLDKDCPKYNSGASVQYVLEINAGLAKKWQLREGDKVTWL